MTVGQTLDDILRAYQALPPEQQEEIAEKAKAIRGDRLMVPNPGPQTEAYFSEADETFYGGSAGGGKTTLICGLAVNEFPHSQIFRREATQLRGIVTELTRMVGGTDGYNAQEKVWKLGSGRMIELAGVKDEDDKEKWQGRAAPLKAFDEITQFSESQYVYIIGWNRSADPSQRCRVVATGNPPTTAEGQWVIRRWRAWLDPTHPDPAKPGELRWYTTIDGEDVEVDRDYIGPKGERPRSRTFIPSTLEDNPDLAETGYASVVEAMPEPLRTMMREGRFDIGQQDDQWQVIPSSWIRLAQARWVADGYQGLRMSAIGVDVAQGGPDESTFAPRYGSWFAPLVVKKGVDTPDGPAIGAQVFQVRRDGALVVLDVGGGYGGDAYRFLSENGVDTVKFNGANASNARTRDKTLGFYNKRAEAWWRFREALDPSQEGGSAVALPPDPLMVADLVAPRWKPRGTEILIESKEDLKKRLGRSPDRGDAVIMSWFEGQAHAIRKLQSHALGTTGRLPQVKLGYAGQKQGRRR